jgi:hypothetical protein
LARRPDLIESASLSDEEREMVARWSRDGLGEDAHA